jgi:hypothetical protein
MKQLVLFLLPLFFLGCDSIGLGGSYPSIYTKSSSECGCDGVMYMIKNPNQKGYVSDRVVRLQKDAKIYP